MSGGRSKVLEGLNPQQLSAVLHGDGPLLILAGAGSGKTKTATARVARLILDGVPPSEICVLTFTNKAAGEIKERIVKACGNDGRGITAGTFHSIGARLLRERPEMVGLRRNFAIYDETDSRSLFKSLLKSEDDDDRDVIKNAFSLLSGARDRGISVLALARAKRILDAPETALAVRNHDAYVKALGASNAVDFAGILLHLRTLCLNEPGLFKSRWSHIIVDEYQDTNAVQDSIITVFAQHGNICAVGDEQQSIYGFRGSMVENILTFSERWPGATVIKLEQNYRSCSQILVPANSILSNVSDGYDKRLIAQRSDRGTVTAWVAENEYDEAARIARKCLTLKERGVRFSDQAIIYRTNAQSRVLEQEMNRHEVPYRIVGGLSFWERSEIKDCIAYLRLLDNRSDDIAFARVINVPKRGLGDSAMNLIRAYQSGSEIQEPESMLGIIMGDEPEPPSELSRSLWDASDLAPLKGAARKAVVEFKRVIESVPQGWANLAIPLAYILESIRYTQHLALDQETFDDKDSNVQQLLELCAGYSDVSEFLEYAALSTESAKDKGGDRVTLCTIHASKGLEWQVVFAPGWESGLFPSPRALAEGQIAEERRLAYVCITRARDMLFIGGARKRRNQITQPSCFLREAQLTIRDWCDFLDE